MKPAASSQSLLDGQKRILDRIAAGVPLPEVLEAICRLIEHNNPQMLTSVLLVDEKGEHLMHGAGPSLPAAYNEAIDGIEVGEGMGSCGTAAATGKPCIVEDIATHPYWEEFRSLAHVTHGLGACWSTPIRATDGRVVATFAIYHRTRKTPGLAERKLIDFASHLVAQAVNRHIELGTLQRPRLRDRRSGLRQELE